MTDNTDNAAVILKRELSFGAQFALTFKGADGWEARFPGQELPVGFGGTADFAIIALTDIRVAEEDDDDEAAL